MALLVLMGQLRSSAQTIREWTRQKSTQKKYLLAQIAANGAFAELLSGGYILARNGLSMVGDFSMGEYSLHRRYFHSLNRASPGVRGSMLLKEIQAIYGSIAGLAGVSGETEVPYRKPAREISVHYSELFGHCAELLDELIGILQNDSLKLSDSQRILRIEKVHGMIKRAHRRILEHQLQSGALRYLQDREYQDMENLGTSYRLPSK